MASFEEWLGLWNRAYAHPDQISGLACPNCGARELSLRFVVQTRQDEGNVAFWCDGCLEGVALGPATVPALGRRQDNTTRAFQAFVSFRRHSAISGM
jgi:hypothetical protein